MSINSLIRNLILTLTGLALSGLPTPVPAQTWAPGQLADSRHRLVSARSSARNVANQQAIELTPTQEGVTQQMLLIEGASLRTGVIEVDIFADKGNPFVGIAFHLENERSYEAVYFRPFRFQDPDPVSRRHAIQYVSEPENSWRTLRGRFPDVYEKTCPLKPDQWQKLVLEIADTNIRVRAGDLPDPVMVITRPFAKKGTGVALWTGAGSKGVFGQVIVKTGKTIPSAAAAPTKPSAPLGKSVSLLDASNPQGGIRGKWQFNDAGLQLLDPEKPALHALSFPKAFDASRGYQLKIDYTLTGPSQSVVAVIPVGDRHCQVVMGGFGGKTDGIALIDGQPV